MKRWIRTSLWLVIFGFAVATMLSIVMMQAAEKPIADDNPHSQRLFKFETSDPDGMNVATQMKFQPGQRAKMKISVQSGKQTSSIEFAVRSDMDADPPHHFIEAHFIEQLGKSKSKVLRRRMVRTDEGVPLVLQVGEFHFEILIQSVK